MNYSQIPQDISHDHDPSYSNGGGPYRPEPALPRADQHTSSADTTATDLTVVHAPLLPPVSPTRSISEPSSPSTLMDNTPYAPSPPSEPAASARPAVSLTSNTRNTGRKFGHQRAVGPRAMTAASSQRLVHFDEAQLAMAAMGSNANNEAFRDELARNAINSITPGVDNSPYIQYALEAINRRRDDEDEDERGEDVDESTSCITSEPNPMYRYLPNSPPALFQQDPRAQAGLRPTTPPQSRHQNLEGVQTTPTPAQYSTPRQPTGAHLSPRSDRHTSRAPKSYPTPWAETNRPSSSEKSIYHHTQPVPQETLTAMRQKNHRTGEGEIRPMGSPPRDADWTWNQILPDIQTPPPPKRIVPPRDLDVWEPRRDDEAEKARTNPPLKFKPCIMRTPSLLGLAASCLLMMVLLMLAAVMSTKHNGLAPYSGTLYDGNYFIMRVVPQFMAAHVLLYAQWVITAVVRVFPFSAMTSDDLRYRRDVGFMPLYLKTFLWPQFIGPWQIWVPIFATWLLNFTIPLASGLFTPVLVHGVWIWKTVQGLAWFLIILYAVLLIATIILAIFWYNRRTGMLPRWDIRCVADIIVLLSQTNTLDQYHGTELVESRNDMKHMLHGNIDRLGYWRAPQSSEDPNWYGIGQSSADERVDVDKMGPAIHVKDPRGHLDSVGSKGFLEVNQGEDGRCRYLPWCFRNKQIITWVVATMIIMIILFAVCFSPSTNIDRGFLPGVQPGPVKGDFSAANFLYSFLSSFLGMIIYLVFQSLDLTLRILTPWAEIKKKNGSTASKSILVDYAACLPHQAVWKAARNSHWHVAIISFLSMLFIMIPVLAGGLFLALTPPSGIVRMYPNNIVLGLVLGLLMLFLFALASLVPNRDRFLLPHAVTCLSEIISFCANDELRTDKVFEYSWSKRELMEKLGSCMDEDRQPRWGFGTGANKDEQLGIKPFPRLTVEPTRAGVLQSAGQKRAKHVLRNFYGPGSISRPKPLGSTMMIYPDEPATLPRSA